jgi:pimeloyl-ACP methyl ester carboxylesterase
MSLTYQKVKCVGGPCYFVEYGGGNAETILLLHGYSDSAKTFEPLREYLGSKYRVIIPDLPMIRRKGINYDLRGLSSFVHEVAVNLNLTKFILCGFSFGGLVAADYAYWYPKRVKKLFLLSCVPRFLAPEMLDKLLTSVGPRQVPLFIYPAFAAFKGSKLGRALVPKTERLEESIKHIRLRPFEILGTFYDVMWHNIVGGTWRERVRKFNKMPMPKAVVLFKDDSLVSYKKYAEKLRRSGVNVISFDKGGHGETRQYWENLKTLF